MFADEDFITWKESNEANQKFTFDELLAVASSDFAISDFYGDCDAGYICYEGSTTN